MTREETIKFYTAHSGRLFNTSLRIVGNSADAEEIMQDTILKFITGSPPVQDERQTRVWLAKTCLRASLDLLRRQKKEKAFLEDYASEATGEIEAVPAELDENTTLADIIGAIGELRGQYALILRLVLVEGFDYEEIAQIEGIREGTVRTQFSRAKAALVKALGEKHCLKR